MKNGFTLVELLAVIIIVGIIAAIAIPEVSSVIDEQRIKAHKIYLKQVAKEVNEELIKNESSQFIDSLTSDSLKNIYINNVTGIGFYVNTLSIDISDFEYIVLAWDDDDSDNYIIYAKDNYGCYSVTLDGEVDSSSCPTISTISNENCY